MSRRIDLPDPTPSEFRHGQDVEPHYPLDPKLPQLPSESSVKLGVNWARSGEVNPNDPCYLGKRCQSCQVYLTTYGLTEPSFPGAMNGDLATLHHHSATPFPEGGGVMNPPSCLSDWQSLKLKKMILHTKHSGYG